MPLGIKPLVKLKMTKKEKAVAAADKAASFGNLYEEERRRTERVRGSRLHLSHCLFSLRYPGDDNGDCFYTMGAAKELGLYDKDPATVRLLHDSLLAVNDSPAVDARQAYYAIVALDSILPKYCAPPPLPPSIRLPDDALPVFQDGLPSFECAIRDTLFSEAVHVHTIPHHVFSKLRPRAGMTRRFGPKIREYIDDDVVFRSQMAEILLCGLLGNYVHCDPASRPRTRLRILLYQIFSPAIVSHRGRNSKKNSSTCNKELDQQYETVRTLFVSATLERVILFALREYALFHVEDEGALSIPVRQQQEKYVCYRRTVFEAMASVRKYLMANMHEEVDANGKAIGTMTMAELLSAPHDTKTDADLKPFQRDLVRIINAAYKQTVKDSYRKERLDPFSQLRATKGRVPPSSKWCARQLQQAGGDKAKIVLHYVCPPTADEKCSTTRTVSRKKKEKEAEDASRAAEAKALADEDAALASSMAGINVDGEDEAEERQLAKDLMGVSLDDFTGESKTVKRGGGGGGGKRSKVEAAPVSAIVATTAAEAASAVSKEDDDAMLRDLADMITRAMEAEDGTADADPTVLLLPDHVPTSVTQPKRTGSLGITRNCVLVEHSRLISQWISYMPETMHPVDAFEESLNFISVLIKGNALGVDDNRRLARQAYRSCDTHRTWESNLARLSNQYPYTHNLIHAAAAAYAKHCSLRRYDLPFEWMVNQCRAVGDRFKLPYDGKENRYAVPENLPMDAFVFACCRVCNNIYSIVRTPAITASSATVFTHGFRNLRIDLKTRKRYCPSDRVSGHERCDAQPLTEISMLGAMVKFGKEYYVICTQPGCGMIGIVHRTETTENEYGFACSACTRVLRNSRSLIPPFVLELVSRRERYVRPAASAVAPLILRDEKEKKRVEIVAKKQLKRKRQLEAAAVVVAAAVEAGEEDGGGIVMDERDDDDDDEETKEEKRSHRNKKAQEERKREFKIKQEEMERVGLTDEMLEEVIVEEEGRVLDREHDPIRCFLCPRQVQRIGKSVADQRDLTIFGMNTFVCDRHRRMSRMARYVRERKPRGHVLCITDSVEDEDDTRRLLAEWAASEKARIAELTKARSKKMTIRYKRAAETKKPGYYK